MFTNYLDPHPTDTRVEWYRYNGPNYKRLPNNMYTPENNLHLINLTTDSSDVYECRKFWNGTEITMKTTLFVYRPEHENEEAQRGTLHDEDETCPATAAFFIPTLPCFGVIVHFACLNKCCNIFEWISMIIGYDFD